MQLESVEKYSPLSNAWIAVAPMSVGRYCHVTVAVSSSIYVLGGFTDDEGTGMDVLKFDSTQGTWSDDSPAPREIIKSAAVAVGTDIYVFGGADEAGNDADFVMKYDTVADEWSILAPMPEDFSCHSASICNGLVYIAGAGYDGQGVLQFDPASGVWSTLSPALSERCYGATFVLGGVLHVAGGELTGSSRAERYDPDTDTWTEVANMLEKRSSFGALTIGSEEPAEEQGLFDFLIDKALHRQL
jgi:N-acetylneuraminic acid mutarotase